MKQKLLLKTMLLLFALIAGSSSVWATEIVYKTQQFSSETFSKGVSGYTGVSFDNTYDGFKCNYSNFNNNNKSWAYVKCGGKNGAYTGTITTDGKIDKAITKVAVTIDAITTSNVTSIKLYKSTNKIDWTELGSFAKSTGVKEVTIASSAEDLYYKIEFVCTQHTSQNGLVTVSKVEFYRDNGGTPICATPTFSPAAGVYTSAQNVEISTTTEDATIYYTTDGSTPTSLSAEYTGAIPVSSTTTIKAIAVKDSYDDSSVASATYIILDHAGTEADPYSVADARAAIDANTGLTGVYVTGIVCEGGSSLSNGAMNYWISDDGTEANKFEIYLGKGIGGADFTATSDVKEGDIVVVTGTIKKHNSTYEFDSGSQLVSLTPSAISSYTFDLSTNSSTSATENLVTWASNYATMTLAKGSSSTAANNYLANSEAHTRMYKDQILKITPVPGYSVTKAVITAVSGNVAGFTGNDWTNASKSTSGSLVTITPTDGTEEFYVTISEACRATAVKVYCESCTASVTVTVTPAGWATYCSPYALDFSSSIANLDGAYIVTGNTGTTLDLSPAITTTVPANTGLLLKGSGEVTIPIAASGAYDASGNKLHGVTAETVKDANTIYVLMNEAGVVGFYKNSNAFTVGANTAYLAVGELEGFEGGSSAPRFMAIGDDNNGTTGVETLNVERGTLNDNSYYNLNGQRVAQPTKGLYIVNGRKVVIK